MTVAPGITDPVLSETVPEKLPVAWPHNDGQMDSREQNTTSSVRLVSIDLSPAAPIEWQTGYAFSTS